MHAPPGATVAAIVLLLLLSPMLQSCAAVGNRGPGLAQARLAGLLALGALAGCVAPSAEKVDSGVTGPPAVDSTTFWRPGLYDSAATACRVEDGPCTCTGDRHAYGVTDVARFAGCETIDGSLTIELINEPSLPTLPYLREIDGDLKVVDTMALRNLDSFPALEAIGGDILIHGTTRLESLQGLERVTRFHGGIHIPNSNFDLTSLDGLQGIQRPALVRIEASQLTSLAGLSGLRQVGTLEILGGPDPMPLDGGLRRLERATHIQLRGIADPTLDGFASLERVSGTISLVDWPNLSDVTAFESVGPTRRLYLFDAPLLCRSHADALAGAVGAEREYYVEGVDEGC